MHRLFVALRPPGPLRALLTALMGGVEHARWQDDAQLHLTLRYIGEVDARTADDVLAALETVRAAPLSIALSGVDIFEHRGRIDALWAGVTPREPLAALHRKLDHALVRGGLLPEGRAYVPHITLARGRLPGPGLAEFMARHGGLSSPPFDVAEFALFESYLGREGASYEAVATFPLAV